MFGPLVSHTDSEKESPSALGSRIVIWRLASPAPLSSSAICDLPFPLKSPLAATPEPTWPTERAGLSGGIGVAVGTKEACA